MTAAPRREVLDVLLQARRAEHEAQVHQLQAALQWALLHPVAEGEEHAAAGWEDPRLYADPSTVAPLAGPGAPLVAHTAAVELAAALDKPFAHALQLLADVTELVFRLPRLWDLTMAGRVPTWVAREISRHTHDLSLDSALYADRLICADPDRVRRVDAARLVHEARLHADPDRAAADEEAAAARRGVWLRRDTTAPGVTAVAMVLDTPDAERLDAAVTRVAGELRSLGDADDLGVRRARAVGVLADPQHALDLIAGTASTTAPAALAGGLDLVVHLTPGDLATSSGTAVVERRGAVTLDRLAAWAQRRLADGSSLTVRPVISSETVEPDDVDPVAVRRLVTAWLARHGLDTASVRRRALVDLADHRAVDAHDPPPLMAEQVRLRDAVCVFPGCRADSRRCDLDHIEPYVPPDRGGPPAQTSAVNLAPLCRRHHNAKTHGGWRYRRDPDGSSYTWVGPTGRTYLSPRAGRAPLTVAGGPA